MERKEPQRNEKKWKALQNNADHGTGLLRALAGYTCYPYRGNWNTELWSALTKRYRKPMA